MTATAPKVATTADGLPARIEGNDVKLRDGVTYTIPPFTFGQLRVIRPMIERVINANLVTDLEAMEETLTVAWAALQRNYPDLKVEEPVYDDATALPKLDADGKPVTAIAEGREALRHLIDFKNVKLIMAAIYDLNDLLELMRRKALSP